MSRPASLRPVLAVMGVALLLALAACSSSTPTSKSAAPSGQASAGTTGSAAAKTPAGPPDACKLVTPAEAQTALAKPVRPAKAALVGPAEAQGASCTYETTDFATGTTAGKALTITVLPRVSIKQSDWDKTWADSGFKAVPGLGDSAWFQGVLLNVWAGGATLAVSIVSLQTEATVDQLASIARLAVPRI